MLRSKAANKKHVETVGAFKHAFAYAHTPPATHTHTREYTHTRTEGAHNNLDKHWPHCELTQKPRWGSALAYTSRLSTQEGRRERESDRGRKRARLDVCQESWIPFALTEWGMLQVMIEQTLLLVSLLSSLLMIYRVSAEHTLCNCNLSPIAFCSLMDTSLIH